MKIQVLEGSLIEVPTAHATGTDRRAFGEFVSDRGEPASYAFGWHTGAEHTVARFTAGIGARNAGWMRHWLLGTTCIQTGEVSDRREPVLSVTHEASDGMWQLIGAPDAGPRTGRIGHLHHAVDEDPTLLDVLDLPPGHTAQRTAPGRPWTTKPAG